MALNKASFASEVVECVTNRCDGPETDFVLLYRVCALLEEGTISADAGANALFIILNDRGFKVSDQGSSDS